MKEVLVSYLACPDCAQALSLEAWKRHDAEIVDGLLRCVGCTTSYAVWRGVPRFVPDALIPDVADYYETYKDKLTARTGADRDGLFALKQKTATNFGSEWEHYADFGWDGDAASERSRRVFKYKILFTPEEISGKLLLDAGTGNGRYAITAAEYGATVIGIDISSADTAYRNTSAHPNLHIVQGDLLKPPFKRNLFDYMFSNGVLMHTGNAREAFLALTHCLNERGVATIHLYHKGNPIYEFNDWWLRLVGVRLPLSVMYRLAKVGAAVARLLPYSVLYYGVNAFMRLEITDHDVFDWYTAPIATHHTYEEVYGWLKEAGLHLVHDHNTTKHPFLRKYYLPFFFLTVKASRQKPAHAPLHTTE